MITKTAEDLYLLGAQEALQSLDLPEHLKVASFDLLLKEAKSGQVKRRKRQRQKAKAMSSSTSTKAPATKVSPLSKLKGIASKVKNPRAAALGGLGLLALGGGGAYGMGAFDSEPELEQDFISRAQRGDLSAQEKALLAAGGAATIGGLGYGASKLL